MVCLLETILQAEVVVMWSWVHITILTNLLSKMYFTIPILSLSYTSILDVLAFDHK